MRKDSGTAGWLRALAAVLLVGGYVVFVRASNAEASAIFAAGGDAGMWDVGVLFASALFLPGTVLLLVSLGTRPDTSRAVAAAAGGLLLAPTAWLALNLYPPDKATGEGSPLDPARWEHVTDLYLAAFVLLGAAGALLLVSAARLRSKAPSPTSGAR